MELYRPGIVSAFIRPRLAGFTGKPQSAYRTECLIGTGEQRRKELAKVSFTRTALVENSAQISAVRC